VRSIAASAEHSLAVTQSGAVFSWGSALQPEAEDSLRPIIVEGFGGARLRQVFAGGSAAFAVSEDMQVFSWGFGENGTLGHGDWQDQLSPKRIEALRGIQLRSVAVGSYHVLALAAGGVLYAWGETSGTHS
jgi:alpha-tubulin suppressor-like RCC1 family protein